jgi:glycosyltransferase involved in cell wall biosynthesis
VPFIWGPIGGAEVFPLRLLAWLSPASAVYEVLRRTQNAIAMQSAGVRDCVRHSAHIFASTPEMESLLHRLGCRDGRTSLLSSAFFTEDQIARFLGESGARTRDRKPSPLKLFAGGDIEGRKGHALALHALARCKAQGLQFRYHIAGLGPEAPYLQALANRLGIADQVLISPPLRGEEYLAALCATDVYLLPSLRDNAPVTLMEAMLSGCVPVVAASGGPDLIVSGECGVRIPVGSGDDMVNQIASVILRISGDRQLLDRLSHGARKRIAGIFHERNYLESVDRAYLKAQIK